VHFVVNGRVATCQIRHGTKHCHDNGSAAMRCKQSALLGREHKSRV
jgi:hypothetical protein